MEGKKKEEKEMFKSLALLIYDSLLCPFSFGIHCPDLGYEGKRKESPHLASVKGCQSREKVSTHLFWEHVVLLCFKSL